MAATEDELDLEPVETEKPKAKKSKTTDAKSKRAEAEDPDNGQEPLAKRDKHEKGKKKDRDQRDEQNEKDDTTDKPKGKGKKAARKNTEDEADDEDDEERRKPPKLGDRKVPYPPSPANVPEDLTEYPESHVRQENRLLISLFLFLAFYIGAVLFCVLIGTWCVWSLKHLAPLKMIGIVFSGVFFLFLVKGFFKRAPIDRDMILELTEDEHPVLFEFIYRLCDEIGAQVPNKVLVSPDVNAACITNVSLLSLFKEPKKDLLIGLGLVNAINLSEFKAVLAHEFGHFCQSGTTGSYTFFAQNVILDMIRGEDWFDRTLNALKQSRTKQIRALGLALGGPLWLWKMILAQVFKMIRLQYLVVSREREFHADLVAVSAAGSDPITHGLLRIRFANECYYQALRDLMTAMDHKMYTNDLFLHQARSAAVVRRRKKEPEMGLPPAIGPEGGKNVRVFDAEQESLEDNDETPMMLRSHPPFADREENAKREYVAAATDQRSAWILFDKPADLRERMTYKFYRMHRAFRIPKNTELTDAVKVQTFIDNEHADITYDPKYNGIYDHGRLIEPVPTGKDGAPGDLDELNRLVVEKPWTDDRIEKVLEKLYEGCRDKADDYEELQKQKEILENTPGKPSKRLKQKIQENADKLHAVAEWARSLDRRVYLIHVQMAGTVNPEWKTELIERYRFQFEVQRLYLAARHHQGRAWAYTTLLLRIAQGGRPHPEFITEVRSVFQESWRGLKKIIQTARDINLPAMKNFEEGDNLADFILEGRMVPEPPSSFRIDWCQKLIDQLGVVKVKCARLHFKSLGGILALQEKIAARWQELRAPIPAAVIEPEPVEAEAIPAEVIEAEVIPAEVVPEDVPAVPAPPAPTFPEPPRTMAAFVPAPAGAEPPEPKLHKPAPAPVVPPPAPAPTPLAQIPEPWKPQPPTPVPAPVAQQSQPEPQPIYRADDLVPVEPEPLAKTTTTRLEVSPPTVAAEPLLVNDERVTDSNPLDFSAAAPAVAPPPDAPAPVAMVPEETQVVVPEVAVPQLSAEPPAQFAAQVAEQPDERAAEQPAAPSTTLPPVPETEAFTLDADSDAPAEPLPAPEPATSAPTEPAPTSFSLDLDRSAPAASFSLDLDQDAPSEPVAEPKAAPAPAAPVPVAPAKPVPEDEVFSLDAEESPVEAEAELVNAEVVAVDAEVVAVEAEVVAVEAEVVAVEAEVVAVEAEAELVEVEEVGFSLDADDHKPAPKPAEPKPPSGVVPAPAAKGFGSAPVPAPAARTQKDEPTSSTLTLSGIASAPAARATVLTKPASGKRPPLKITLVRPGEKSPIKQ